MKRVPDSTDCVHAGSPKRHAYDAVPMPLVQTATYTFEGTKEIADFTSGEHENADREEYGRYGNPTTRSVERRMAALERTEDALLFGSGMAAITTSLLALVKSGQHVILFSDAYRMTREFVTATLGRFGVTHTLLDPGDLAGLAGAIRPETRLVISEMPTNPYLYCTDLAEFARICKARKGVRTMIDATLATPVNCNPASYGIDLVVHSATKYLGGHHDVLAGVVAGSSGLISLVRDLRNMLGSVCDPHAAFLVERGLKTLALRVRQQNATAMKVARWLESSGLVDRVFYPGLESHPTHGIAAAQMTGFGGVVSFVVKGGYDAAGKVVDRMGLAKVGPSFGGVESLIEQPAVMSFYALSAEERKAVGVDDGLIRFGVGIEEADDLISALRNALT